MAEYILREIKSIGQPEIDESHQEEGYPTVLIIGRSQYLKPIYKILSKLYPQAKFKTQDSNSLTTTLFEGYELLIQNPQWNLPWRILAGLLIKDKMTKMKLIKKATESGRDLVSLLEKKFVDEQLRVIYLIQKIKEGNKLARGEELTLEKITKISVDAFYLYFQTKKKEIEGSSSEIKILLTTFQSSKGLSGGRVFIVGVNNGDIPRKESQILDEEISELIVALTRTRKCCYLISSYRYVSQRKSKSILLDWIPNALLKNLGYFNKNSFKEI